VAGEFQAAGEELIRKLERALVEEARAVMVDSIIECPISGPETYVPQFREVDGRTIYLGDDPDMVGDSGTLRRSARIFAPRNDGASITVEMGYGFGEEVNPAGRLAAEYAVPVHERTELAHNPPTKSGYLLDPLLAHATSFGGDIAIRMQETMPAEQPYGAIIADGQDLGAE
jgi:hypothetical protein